MSYSIRVDVKNGVATVVAIGTTTGAAAPPDGVYSINGHVPSEGTWQAETISIARSEPRDDNGNERMIIQASGTHHRIHLPQ